jgi:hypothetical protein
MNYPNEVAYRRTRSGSDGGAAVSLTFFNSSRSSLLAAKIDVGGRLVSAMSHYVARRNIDLDDFQGPRGYLGSELLFIARRGNRKARCSCGLWRTNADVALLKYADEHTAASYFRHDFLEK